MALGKRPGGNAADEIKESTLDELKKEFDQTYHKIQSLLNGKGDLNQLDREQKSELRRQYSKLMHLARQISQRTTDAAERKKFAGLQEQARNEAVRYGSAATQSTNRIHLDDVKGLKEVKAMVSTFLYMLQNPEILRAYHMEGGLGLMLYGAPGTGKTMIAEAIATEMDMQLFVITPANIFKSYVGESEQAVKELFQEIEACDDGAILFVDECESIFSKRTSDDKDYKAAVTTELLQRINGFGVDGSKRILIGATNRPDKIDPAYLRHKRFSHLIHITPPDAEALREIVQSKMKDIPCEVSEDDLLYMFTVHGAGGRYSAADVCGIIEEACMQAIEQMVATKSTAPIPLTRDMFEKAFAKKGPSITPEALRSYEEFGAKVEALK